MPSNIIALIGIIARLKLWPIPDDKAEDLAVHHQAYIHRSGGPLLISIMASRQPNRAKWVSRQSNPVKFLSGSQGSPTVPSPYPGLKAVQPSRVLIRVSRQSNQTLNRFQNCSRRVHYQGRSSCVTRQDPSHLANTLANINGLLVSTLRHQTQWSSKGAFSSSSQ